MIVYCRDRSMKLPRKSKKEVFVSKLARIPPFQSARLDNIPSMCNTMYSESEERKAVINNVISDIKTPGRTWLAY